MVLNFYKGIVMVYPRVGGGTGMSYHYRTRGLGLSPRGRGNLFRPSLPDGAAGSIPAWAGEPTHGCGTRTYSTVYPRVGGGTTGFPVTKTQDEGLSPRGRGNHGVSRHEDSG